MAELQGGTAIAGYRIERLLGRGGMGAVYLAEDVRLERQVALKLLAPELAEDARFRERFLRESKLAASLDHPAIVPIFQAGEADGTLFIAMRYVEGTDLRRLLEQGPLDVVRTIAIGVQVASALDAAHRRGLVHRDVKPGNVLLDEEGNAYLSDFGLTKQASSQSGLTQTGQLVGTLDYLAPEQIEGRKVDGRADVYSLGCLLCECLTGRRPFARGTEAATLWAHVHESPPTIGDTGVDAVLARALAKKPDERYATAGEFVSELQHALGLSSGALGRPAFARRRRRLYAAVVAAAAAVAVAIAGLLVFIDGGSAVTVVPNSVAIIDPHGDKIVGDIPIDSRSPAAIAAGAGALWVGSLEDNTITRINPATRKVVRLISLNATPIDLAVGPSGVWVANGNAGTVSRINPLYNQVVDEKIPVDVQPSTHSGPRAISVGRKAVWVANLSRSASRIDPATNEVKTSVDVGTSPWGIATGAGATWVANNYDNTISRIDPSEAVTTFHVGRGPSTVAVGLGAVWVADTLDDTVVKIDPSTSAVVATIRVGRYPNRIAIGAGAVWIANERDGTVSRVDPTTNKVTMTITVGNSPSGIAFVDGLVWVTVEASTLSTSRPRPNVARIDVDLAGWLETTDPAIAYPPNADWRVLYATCLKLLNYPDKPAPAGSQLVPEAAARMPIISADGETYRFAIRKGFRFSPPSNEPVTARTFKYSIERTLKPQLRSWAIVNGYLDAIAGVTAYEAGKARHIKGITAAGSTLTIRLVQPDPTLPTKLAMPFFCAVPVGTPSERGVPPIPSAGPYYVDSFQPGKRLVLKLNPNYNRARPHRLAEIDYAIDVGEERTVQAVTSGRADYVGDPIPPTGLERLERLDQRYGPNSPAARAGRQRYFVEPGLSIYYLAMNTSRPLFANVELRRAVNYAIDRTALARIAGLTGTDQFLPPGMPGFQDARIYPFKPDLRKARRLAAGRGGRAVLYVSNHSPERQEAQLVKRELQAIGIDVVIEEVNSQHDPARRGEPSDLALPPYASWGADYPDPSQILNTLFDGASIEAKDNINVTYFDDLAYNRRFQAAAKLSGPSRYRTYGRLDIDLARNAAPGAAWGNGTSINFFSARMGCQVFNPIYGLDLAALCIR